MNTSTSRTNMITQQLRTGNVLNEQILELFTHVPRDAFVPSEYRAFAYSDMQIPLGHGQRMFTPLEEGQLVQALNLQGHEVVLEIGTGCGYLTALLSRLCKQVISIEYYADISAIAERNLALHQCTNVQLVVGDGCQGWFDKAPYDVIIFSGSLETLSESQRLQLLPGGKLFALLGRAPVMQGQLLTLDHQEQWQEQLLFETELPPLVNKLHQETFVF